MPLGKKIRLDGSLDDFTWFDFNRNWRNRGFNRDWEDNWGNDDDDSYSWTSDVDYIMTDHGLERSAGNKVIREKESPAEDQPDHKSDKKEEAPKDGYRYHKTEPKKVQKTVTLKSGKDFEEISPLILLTKWS
jgi:hypothetical protein